MAHDESVMGLRCSRGRIGDLNESDSPILAPGKTVEGLSRKQLRPPACKSTFRVDEGKDTWCTLGRIIPQGMQGEDKSTDRKALVGKETRKKKREK